jgi:hypothetical protein
MQKATAMLRELLQVRDVENEEGESRSSSGGRESHAQWTKAALLLWAIASLPIRSKIL